MNRETPNCQNPLALFHARQAAISKMMRCQVAGQAIEILFQGVTPCHATRVCDTWRALFRISTADDTPQTLLARYYDTQATGILLNTTAD